MVYIDFDKALLSPENKAAAEEEEEEKLVDEYFRKLKENGDYEGDCELDEYMNSHASPGLLKAQKEREIYCAELRKKGIIVN